MYSEDELCIAKLTKGRRRGEKKLLFDVFCSGILHNKGEVVRARLCVCQSSRCKMTCEMILGWMYREISTFNEQYSTLTIKRSV